MPTGRPRDGDNEPFRGGERPVPLVVVLLCWRVSLTACGGSPSSGVAGRLDDDNDNPGSAPQTPLAVALRYATCMRSNGVTNYPDPSNSGRPQSLNHIDPNSPVFLKAYTACRKYAPKGGIGPPAPTAAQLRFALAFAQCVHKHGFPQFPEPLATAPDPDQKEFTLGQGMYFPVLATTRDPVAGVHAGRQGVRSGASLTADGLHHIALNYADA